MSILDHIGYAVTDYARARSFYDAALAPLGIKQMMEFETDKGMLAGYGVAQPEFWIGEGAVPGGRIHMAFRASSRAMVDAFHAAALAAGGTDNGQPGLRPHYHPNYYGAFVLDPDGHNVEAVCHAPE